MHKQTHTYRKLHANEPLTAAANQSIVPKLRRGYALMSQILDALHQQSGTRLLRQRLFADVVQDEERRIPPNLKHRVSQWQ
jgi:hypothetical protein